MNKVVLRYFRAIAVGAAALLVTTGAPQLARAAAPTATQATATAQTAARESADTQQGTATQQGAQPTEGKPSGTDASCPATSSATAGDQAVGAPTLARAIGGSKSATVVWCPPATGASHVTSYTVTANPGGDSVTATVPNDWAIIDGLADGTSYTFTVTANTSTANGTKADTTNPVTPAPIPEPTNVVRGKPATVSYDQYSMLIGGQRKYITAGEFDPWRTPSPSLWLDDLEKMKADGYDAVTVYFDWDYNSPAPGAYDFTGVRDYNEFLNMAQQAGLYVIARPGPYINAETDGGGIPSWVLTGKNGYRSDVQPYLSAARQWLSEIDPIIAAHQATRGGDVIAYQVENEYTGQGTSADDYMAALEQQARSDGIDVPFTFNQCCGSQTYTSGTGAVNISGTDNYPLGFNCSNPSHFGQPQSGYPVYKNEPVYLPEYQGGSFDGWGGAGFANCYQMTGPDFENVYYKDNIAQGATMQSYYMGVGGTNWGWLPDPQVYSSYDYGAGISETGEIGTPSDPNDVAGSKYGENKLINDFETSVAPLDKTQPATAPKASNPAITTVARANPDTGTQFTYVRQSDATSTTTASTHLALNLGSDGNYPVVPQSGTITLEGRDSRLLTSDYDFGGQHLVYSTSELTTQASIGGRDTALLYDPQGTDGETVLRYASQPDVKVLSGNVTSTWDASRGDLRLDYVHNGLAEVEITGGGRPPLLLLIADTNTAENFWPEQTAAGPVLVEGGYLVRSATVRGGVLDLTGDISKAGKIRVWAGAGIRSVEWNGKPVATATGPDGSLTGTVPGPAPVHLPTLTNWKFAPEAPEAQPGFNDSDWTLADHPVSNTSSPSTPVLYASDYGYDHGFTWYRGHFQGGSGGSATGVTLTADGIAPTGAYSVWLNGKFLGSATAAGAQTHTFSFPAGAVRSGDNVIAVLAENTGNPEGPSGEKTGLYQASLTGSSAPITWRLMGTPGGSTLTDPVRGIMNGSGLFGSDHGWDLPGYPDQSWQNVSLPDSWSARNVPPGVGWYRSSFSLNLPPSSYVPIDVQVGGPGPGPGGTADYRAFIYVNGWLVGRYINNTGPQHKFYVPAGILNDHGPNTLAIAVWGLDQAGGGLANVSLVAAGNQAGGLPIAPVPSPGYKP
ncbi:MAG: beta-galactosidase [Nocardiopsaceae bacterium]|nr:beta-galactosidase [Nocardiopsaceae bacterium]